MYKALTDYALVSEKREIDSFSEEVDRVDSANENEE